MNNYIGDIEYDEALINKLFVIDYLYKSTIKLMTEDAVIVAYYDIYVGQEHYHGNDDFDYSTYISNLREAAENSTDNKYLSDIVNYINAVLQLYRRMDIALSQIPIAKVNNDFEKLSRDFDIIMHDAGLDRLEKAYDQLEDKAEPSGNLIKSMKKFLQMYNDPKANSSSFDRYHIAYRLVINPESQVFVGSGDELSRLYTEFCRAEMAFLFANLEYVLPTFFNDRSVIAFCAANYLDMPDSGDTVRPTRDSLNATNNFLNQFKGVMKKLKENVNRADEDIEFYLSELNYFENMTTLLKTLISSVSAIEQIKPKSLFNKGRLILQNNDKIFEMIDTLCDDIRNRKANVEKRKLIGKITDLKRKAEQFVEENPIINYNEFLDQVKQAREARAETLPSQDEVADEILPTEQTVVEAPQPTITDIAKQKYTEFEQLRDTVISLKDYDDETLVEFKLIVDHYNSELSKLISGKAIDSESLAEQVIAFLDDFSNGEYAKYLDKFMYDITYHAQYELNELLSQRDTASLQQRDTMTNISDKASKFGERYKQLVQETEDGSLDGIKILSAYEKLADIKKEIAKLYNIYPSDVADRFSIKGQ